MTRLKVDVIAKAVSGNAAAEIVLSHSIGDYIAFGDTLAEIKGIDGAGLPAVEAAIRDAIALEGQRDLDTDPAFGVQQLVTIGWTSISTAKSNPNPGLLTILSLRDLLARWLHSDPAFGVERDSNVDPRAPIVYTDRLSDDLMRAFESIAVVASESMQHQNAAELYRAIASLFHRLPQHLRRQAEDLILRSLSGLGDHVLTSDLESSLAALATSLNAAGSVQCAKRIRASQEQLALGIGRLNSRSTRARATDSEDRPGLAR